MTTIKEVAKETSFFAIPSSQLSEYIQAILHIMRESGVLKPILLYSDPGAGKSSAIKDILNMKEFKDEQGNFTHSFIDFRVPSLTVFDLIGYPKLTQNSPDYEILKSFVNSLENFFSEEDREKFIITSSAYNLSNFISPSGAEDLVAQTLNLLGRLKEKYKNKGGFESFISGLRKNKLNIEIVKYIFYTFYDHPDIQKLFSSENYGSEEINPATSFNLELRKFKEYLVNKNIEIDDTGATPSATTYSVNFFLILASKFPSILFFDEINRCQDITILNSSLALFLDRKIPTNNVELHRDTIIFAAANPRASIANDPTLIDATFELKPLPKVLLDRAFKIPVYEDQHSNYIFNKSLLKKISETSSDRFLGFYRIFTSRDLLAIILAVLAITNDRSPEDLKLNNMIFILIASGYIDHFLERFSNPAAFNSNFSQLDTKVFNYLLDSKKSEEDGEILSRIDLENVNTTYFKTNLEKLSLFSKVYILFFLSLPDIITQRRVLDSFIEANILEEFIKTIISDFGLEKDILNLFSLSISFKSLVNEETKGFGSFASDLQIENFGVSGSGEKKEEKLEVKGTNIKDSILILNLFKDLGGEFFEDPGNEKKAEEFYRRLLSTFFKKGAENSVYSRYLRGMISLISFSFRHKIRNTYNLGFDKDRIDYIVGSSYPTIFMATDTSMSIETLMKAHKEFTYTLLSRRSIDFLRTYLDTIQKILLGKKGPRAKQFLLDLHSRGIFKTYLYNFVLGVTGYYDKVLEEAYGVTSGNQEMGDSIFRTGSGVLDSIKNIINQAYEESRTKPPEEKKTKNLSEILSLSPQAFLEELIKSIN